MRKFLLVAFLAVSLTACKKDKEDVKVDFIGTWYGNYTGTQDNGSLAVEIDANGNLEGLATSSKFMEFDAITGKVKANGDFTGTTTGGAEFTGKFTATTASGTWKNTTLGISGNWTGTKGEQNK